MRNKLKISTVAFTLAMGVTSFVTPMEAQASSCLTANPLAAMRVTSPFGMRLHPVTKVKKLHSGIDLRAAVGTPLFAPADGEIALATFHEYAGNYINFKTSGSDISYFRFLHMSRFNAKSGTKMKAGDIIGLSGNTGRGTAPHLHFEIHKKSYKDYVNPANYLCNTYFPAMGGKPAYTSGGSPTIAPTEGGAGDDPFGTNAPDPSNSTPDASPANMPFASPFPDMSEMPVHVFLQSESAKRFANPMWYEELNDPGAMNRRDPKFNGNPNDAVIDPKIHMLRELNIMIALKNLMNDQINSQRTSIESTRAIMQSMQAKEYSEKILSLTRSQIGRNR